MNNQSIAFKRGQEAAQRGKSVDDCPYAVGGKAYNEWCAGYRTVRPKWQHEGRG